MELVGYARVSWREERQVFDRQVDALKAAGCERVFEDRGSGASTNRTGLKETAWRGPVPPQKPTGGKQKLGAVSKCG